MNSAALLSLGLGLESPWKLTGQRVDTGKTPTEVFQEISSDRGTGGNVFTFIVMIYFIAAPLGELIEFHSA